jgi:hypothetical protein
VLLAASFGNRWLYGGQMSATFVAPAHVDRSLVLSAEITVIDPDALCHIDLRMNDAIGTPLVRGNAFARAGRGAPGHDATG